MSNIFIVNHCNLSSGLIITSSYHHDPIEASKAFEAEKASVTWDPSIIELVCLDTETLDGTYIKGWEGTLADFDDDDHDGEVDDA